MEPKVIFQDESLLVLDKPPGWVVNDAATTKNLNTVQSWLHENFKYETLKDFDYRSGIVHRLDKDTSGVLLVAKTKDAFRKLQAQFKARVVKKTYVALVHGKVLEANGEITATVGRLPWNRKKFGILPGGREATTSYRLISSHKHLNNELSFLELYPKTGRTHQIRVHLKHIGHPIVSDKTYAGRKTWRHDSKWCPRIFLHASKMSISHPKTSKTISFESELPHDLQKALLVPREP